jgi:transposase InsO family protein
VEEPGCTEGQQETEPRIRRRRRRMRGRRHVPPRTSTDVQDLVPEREWTPEYLAAMQQVDKDLCQVRNWKMGAVEKPNWSEMRGCSPALKAYWQQYDSIVVHNGVLYRSFVFGGGRPDVLQFLAPASLQLILLELAHADAAGHLAVKKTEGQLQQRAYWYDWKTAVLVFCRKCAICNSHHRGPPPRNGLLQPFNVGAPNERWCVDLTGEHPKSANGYVYVLTAMDCFTKYVVCVPLRNKMATTVGKAIVERIFLQYGLTELHSDGGGEFDNEILTEICRLTGVAKVKTTPYEPSSNPVERFHRTMHSLLAKVISEHQKDWDSYLAYITFCYNTSIHQATGYTPYFLMHGAEARWNMDVLLDSKSRKLTQNEHASSVVNRLAEAYQQTREHLGSAAAYSKGWYDRKVKQQVYQVGEAVRILDQRAYAKRTPKWQLPYSQVGKVTRKLNDVTYVVSAPSWRGPRVLHVDKLRRMEDVSRPVPQDPGHDRQD